MTAKNNLAPPRSSALNGIWIETFFFICVCGFSLAILCIYGGMELHSAGNVRWKAAVIAISPAILTYFLLRNFGGKWFSAFFVLIAISLLALGHKKKMALTGTPLSWNDVANAKNFRVAVSYLTALDWFIFLVAAVCLVAFLKLSFSKFTRPSLTWSALRLLLATPLAAVSFYPYVANAELDQAASNAGISYMSWDWPGNIKRNGLLIHLVHTSLRPVPAPPTASELSKIAQLPRAPQPVESPQHVFYVLCESCWNDSQHFAEIFKPLEKRGLIPIRAVSPAYGGGTVNATFEMLTGLPVQGPLIGMVFQEYGRIFLDDSRTVVSSMKEEGYRTIALHNYFGDFWQRDVVMPKLGFQQFISLEQMNYTGSEKFPPDSLLFDNAIALLSKNTNEKVFFNLETVHMHGPYLEKGDFGERNYEERLKTIVRDLDEFIGKVDKLSKNSLIVIYGDHKPSLNRFFAANGIIGKNEFARTGLADEDFVFSADVNMKRLGDVPVLIGYVGSQKNDNQTLRGFVADANNKPFYCLGAQISYFLLPAQDSSSRFMVSQVCKEYDHDSYHANRARVPAWLYSANLF